MFNSNAKPIASILSQSIRDWIGDKLPLEAQPRPVIVAFAAVLLPLLLGCGKGSIDLSSFEDELSGVQVQALDLIREDPDFNDWVAIDELTREYEEDFSALEAMHKALIPYGAKWELGYSVSEFGRYLEVAQRPYKDTQHWLEDKLLRRVLFIRNDFRRKIVSSVLLREAVPLQLDVGEVIRLADDWGWESPEAPSFRDPNSAMRIYDPSVGWTVGIILSEDEIDWSVNRTGGARIVLSADSGGKVMEATLIPHIAPPDVTEQPLTDDELLSLLIESLTSNLEKLPDWMLLIIEQLVSDNASGVFDQIDALAKSSQHEISELGEGEARWKLTIQLDSGPVALDITSHSTPKYVGVVLRASETRRLQMLGELFEDIVDWDKVSARE